MQRRLLHLSSALLLAITITLGLALVLTHQTSLVSTSALAQGACPTVQNTPQFTLVYGPVSLNGQPALTGTVVEARNSGGVVAGCFIVNSLGSYGAMFVYGKDNTVTPPIPGMEQGETIAFYVAGSVITATPALTWSNDTDHHLVNLSAIIPPTANFTTSVTAGIAPLTIQFTDQSSGSINDWLWRFGDGITDTLESPTHTYPSAGVYTVSLTVSGPGGSNTLTKTNYVTVYEPVQAGFTASLTSGVASLSVDFTNLSTGDFNTCAWNFGDGGTSTSCNNPSYTYPTAGIYTVILAVNGPGGSNHITRTNYITVYEPVQADFGGSPTSGQLPLAVQFNDQSSGSIDTWLWNFGDGITSALKSPVHTYTVTGVYTVSLTASGPGGSQVKTMLNYIVVAAPNQANFKANPISGVAPLVVQFTNQPTGTVNTWLWNFGDGITSTLESPAHTYPTPGVYTVTLTVNGSEGDASEVKANYITVYGPVQANFRANPVSGIAPLNVDFTNLSAGDFNTCIWIFGDGDTRNTCTGPIHTYPGPGVYTVTLTASGVGGNNSMTKTNYITVYTPVQADFNSSPTSGVKPLRVDFTNLSSGDYDTCTWSFGAGSVDSNSCSNPSYTYTVAGTYTVTLTVSGPGGSKSVTKTRYISVYTPVQVNFGANPTSGSASLAVNFTNLSVGDYSLCTWIFGDGDTSNLCDNPDHTYTAAGVYTITLTASGSGGSNTITQPNYITVTSPDNIVINEVNVGEPDWIELYNSGSQAINITGWHLLAYAANGTVNRDYTMPAFILQPDTYVVLHETAGVNTTTDLYFNANISDWVNDGSGAAALTTGDGIGVDFLRWGTTTTTPPVGTSWLGNNPAGPPTGKTLGRDSTGTDTDDSGDWTAQEPSPGTQNVGSGASVYLPVIMK